MDRKPKVIDRADWARHGTLWRGRFEGADLETEVSVLFFASEDIGAGPPLHTHPYDEIFILRQGRALYTIGETRIEAVAGQILTAPAEIPHKFENLGPGLLETIDIHLSPRVIQTDLEPPTP